MNTAPKPNAKDAGTPKEAMLRKERFNPKSPVRMKAASSRLKPTKNWLSLETGGVYGLAEAACQTSFRDMRAYEMRLISMVCV
jgi:hypothetical protein